MFVPLNEKQSEKGELLKRPVGRATRVGRVYRPTRRENDNRRPVVDRLTLLPPPPQHPDLLPTLARPPHTGGTGTSRLIPECRPRGERERPRGRTRGAVAKNRIRVPGCKGWRSSWLVRDDGRGALVYYLYEYRSLHPPPVLPRAAARTKPR